MLSLDGLERDGLMLVPARVSTPPQGAAARGVAPRHHGLTLMLDTGARFSVVNEDLLGDLGEAPIGTTPVRTSMHAAIERPLYRVVLTLELVDLAGAVVPVEHPATVISAPVAVADAAGQPVPHHGILGLDILRSYRFTYDGPTHAFSLTRERPR